MHLLPAPTSAVEIIHREVIVYTFGPYRLLPAKRLLCRGGQVISLPPKAFETLLVLVENNGRLLTKDALMRMIWEDRVVEEGNLSQNIFLLRKLLGECPHDHQYIVTVPGQGYRFVAKVTEIYNEDCRTPDELRDCARPKSIGAKISSLAILPFTCLSARAEEQPEGAGLAVTLITMLSRLERLIIPSTATILKQCETNQDSLEVGRALGVEAVLDGTIQRWAEFIRVNVRLINLADGVTIWAQTFSDQAMNAFEIQDAIATRIVRALEARLGSV